MFLALQVLMITQLPKHGSSILDGPNGLYPLYMLGAKYSRSVTALNQTCILFRMQERRFFESTYQICIYVKKKLSTFPTVLLFHNSFKWKHLKILYVWYNPK